MRAITYYSPLLLVATGEEAAHATIPEIKAFARRAADERKGSKMFLRDASMFNGNLERLGGKYPDAVLLLGPDNPAFDRIREAFKAVEVEVTQRDGLPAEEVPFPETEEDDEDDDEVTRLNLLKARATELGINFNPNIGYPTLAARVEAREKELADENPEPEEDGEEEESEEDDSNQGE